MSFLYDILPNYTKSIATKTDTNITGTVNVLEEYLKVYDTEIFGMASSAIAELLTFKDIELIDEKYLPYYAYLLGYEWNNNIDSNIQRNFIINLIDLYKRKGTFFSLHYLLHQIDKTVTIYEPEVDRFIVNESKLSGSSKYADVKAIKFITSLEKYILLTHDGLYISDLTAFWDKRISDEDLKEVITNLNVPEYVTFNSNHIYRSTNGLDWEIVTSIKNIIDVAYISFLESYVVTSASEGIYLSTDCFNWFKVSDICGGNNICSKDGSIVLSVINRGILCSSDGFDWEVVLESNIINNLMYTDILGYYVASTDNDVYTSTDGITWITHKQLTNITCGVYVSSQELFYVGRSDGVYTSSDNVSWEKKLDAQNVTALCYSETFNSEGLLSVKIYVGTQNYGLYYSIDGENYQQIANIPNISFIVSATSMANGNSRVLVFTDEDIYYSDDGDTWEIISQIQLITGATYSDIFKKFYVSTTMGVFSSEYGDTWEQCYNQSLSDDYEVQYEVDTYEDLLLLKKGQVFQDNIIRVLDTNLLYIVSNVNKLLTDDFTPSETNNAFEQYFTYFNYYSTTIYACEKLLNDDVFNVVLVGTRCHGMYATSDGYNFVYKSDLDDVQDIKGFVFDSALKVVVDSVDGYDAKHTPLDDSVDGGNARMNIQDSIDGYSAKNNDKKQYVVVCTLEGIYFSDDIDFWQQGANTRYGQSTTATKVVDSSNDINITCTIINNHYVITEYIDDDGVAQTSTFNTLYTAICVLYSETLDVFVLGSYSGLYISYDGIMWEQISSEKVLYLYEVYDGVGGQVVNYIIYNTADAIYASENITEWTTAHERKTYNFTLPTANSIYAYSDENIYYSQDFNRWYDQYPVPKITKAILKLVGDEETLQGSRVFTLANTPALYEDVFRSKDVVFTKINKDDYVDRNGNTILNEDEYHSPYDEDEFIESDVYAVSEKPSLDEFVDRDVILTNGEITETVQLHSSNVYALYLLPNVMSLFQDHDVVITIYDDQDYSNGILAGTLDGVYESYDGITWSKILDCGTVYDIVYIGALNRYLVASYKGLYTSSTGEAWTRVIDTKSLKYNSLAFELILSDTMNIFVGTRDIGLYYSNDGLTWTKYSNSIANDIKELKYFPSPQYYSPGVIVIQYNDTIDGIDDIVEMVKPAGIYHLYRKYHSLYINTSIRPETAKRNNWVNTWFNWEDYPDFDIWAEENIDYFNALQYNSGTYYMVMHQGHTFYSGTFAGDMSTDYPYYHVCDVCYASKVNVNSDVEKDSNSIVYVHRLNVQRSYHGTKEEFETYIKDNYSSDIEIIDNICCYDEDCPLIQAKFNEQSENDE